MQKKKVNARKGSPGRSGDVRRSSKKATTAGPSRMKPPAKAPVKGKTAGPVKMAGRKLKPGVKAPLPRRDPSGGHEPGGIRGPKATGPIQVDKVIRPRIGREPTGMPLRAGPLVPGSKNRPPPRYTT